MAGYEKGLPGMSNVAHLRREEKGSSQTPLGIGACENPRPVPGHLHRFFSGSRFPNWEESLYASLKAMVRLMLYCCFILRRQCSVTELAQTSLCSPGWPPAHGANASEECKGGGAAGTLVSLLAS